MSIFDIFRSKKKIKAPWEKYYNDAEKNIRIPNISMYDQIKLSTYKYPNKRAINYINRDIKYKTFFKWINRASCSFKRYGIKKGDIVTICLPNIPNCLVALYGLNRIGAIANMVHPLSASEEIKTAITSTRSKFVFVLDLFYDKVIDILDDTCCEMVIVCSAADYLQFPLNILYKFKNIKKIKNVKYNDNTISYKKFMRMGSGIEFSEKRYGKDTAAVILHSGGTSGKPKNVVLQNRAFILGSKQEQECLKLSSKDSCLAIMPNFHGFGLSVCMHTPLSIGASTCLVPEFNGKKFDVLFKQKKPSIVLGVPTLFEALITYKNVENFDLSFLRYAISGGDILTKNLEERVNNFFIEHNSRARITQGYGLSEALAAVCLAYDDINKSGSIGIPLPGNHIKIIDPATLKEVKYGDVGEIVIHSKALMMGYLNDESETNAALKIHDDGHVWLHTGDLGYMDKDGFVFYKGRQKRMIITSGYNVYPAHVEEVIESHPAVLQCTVVGVPHPYKQEVGKAFIVLKDGYHKIFVQNDIKEYCKKNLAKYMIPYYFVYRKQLPKTKLGKVDFRKLQSEGESLDDE